MVLYNKHCAVLCWLAECEAGCLSGWLKKRLTGWLVGCQAGMQKKKKKKKKKLTVVPCDLGPWRTFARFWSMRPRSIMQPRHGCPFSCVSCRVGVTGMQIIIDSGALSKSMG